MFANPVPPDDLSLLNGADLFEQHCTECHGWDPSEQYTDLYSEDPVDVDDPLLDILQPSTDVEEEPDFIEEPEDYWPDYAERPDEDVLGEDERLKSDVLDDLTSAIDEIYNDESDPWGYEVEDYDDYETYEELLDEDEDAIEASLDQDALEAERRMPGATDLTDPDEYVYGTTETDLYDSIAHGTGPTMQGFAGVLRTENDVWDLVNYIRSLWGQNYVD
ncbi:MAG: hypothetical protein Hals2KO_18390 [Halioglobus sp.]